MALSYKARRWWSAAILLIGLPIYIVVVISVLSLISGRIPMWLELILYVFLGVAWALPFKSVFKGVGKPDPDRDPDSYPK